MQADEDKDHEEEGVLGRPSIWVGTHTIYYRAAHDTGDSNEPTSSKCSNRNPAPSSKSSKKSVAKRNKDTSPSGKFIIYSVVLSKNLSCFAFASGVTYRFFSTIV